MLSQNASKTTASLLVYYFLLRSYDLVHSDIPYQLCPNTTVQFHDSLFRQNLDNLLASLSSNASFSNFFATSSSSDPKIYGQYMCYGSKTRESCETCVKAASQNIKAVCPNATEAVRWEEECQLRYSNNNFFGALDVTGNKEQNNSVQQRSDRERFRFFVTRILSDVAKKAALDRSLNKYAFNAKNYKRNKTLYAVAQCTGDLSSDNCRKCLEVAIANVSSCCSLAIGARILSKSCYLRYEMYNFYGGVPEKGYKIWNNRRVIIVAVSSFVAICLLGYLLHCRKTSIRAKKGKDDQELPLHNRNDRKIDFDKLSFKSNGESKEMLYFDLATISEATRNFSESNMLGQGGFGPVYKGTLSDGSEIAVKRLSGFSKQGLEEFTNEVLLLIKLQHKNLVRLLGFSGDREEKLLIYELMPNRSLDAILFDPTKRIQLDWKSRLNIINGIARGMLYLHEDSRLKIIHRDLKAINILLDDHLNPKISDFGMARIFVGSDGEASTCRLVGTYGYMAPEYAMEGRYSVKSDVFSFGVLLLEIITGEKNTSFQQSRSAPNLIAYAWQLWNEGKELELMDPLLTEIFARDAFRKCVYIGLLCVQEDANDRPTMSSVVVMLNGETEALRQPERPAFSWGTSDDYDETIVDSFSLTNVNISSASCPLERE